MSGVLTLVLVVGVLCSNTHSTLTSAASIRASKATNESLSPPYLRPTWIDIDLDLVRVNVQQLKSHIGSKVHLMAVIKANAYGYGIMEIARTSLAGGASWLGVATLDEALVLRREFSKDVPILVLGYVPSEHLWRASDAGVTVTGISLEWIQEADRVVKQPLDFHLKIDTGMNRLGCRTEEEVQQVLAVVARNQNLRLKGVFTHFATSEDLTNRTYFQRQLKRFGEFLEIIPNRTEKLIHCANSGATLYHPEKPFYDMVRCGKALTGPPNQPLVDNLPVPLKTVISLHSVLSLVKEVEANEKIGYGDFYTTPVKQWIGTIPIGYGDGWRQILKTVGVLVDGKRRQIIGRISMDQMMIVLDKYYPVGTVVTLIGQQGNETIYGDDIAREANIPRSEIFSGLSSRVPRIYKLNGTAVIPTTGSANVHIPHSLVCLLGLIAYFSSN